MKEPKGSKKKNKKKQKWHEAHPWYPEGELRRIATFLDVNFGPFYDVEPGVEDYEPGKIEVHSETPSTKQILQKVPEEIISDLLSLYRGLNFKSTARDRQGGRALFPRKQYEKIRHALKEMADQEWLDQEQVDKIGRFIQEQMAYNPKGSDKIVSRLLDECFSTGGRPKKEPALDLLIVILVKTLKRISSKPVYDLVTGFLFEQGVLNEDEADVAIVKKRYERNRKSVTELKSLFECVYKALSLGEDLSDQAHTIPADAKTLSRDKESPMPDKIDPETFARLLKYLKK